MNKVYDERKAIDENWWNYDTMRCCVVNDVGFTALPGGALGDTTA